MKNWTITTYKTEKVHLNCNAMVFFSVFCFFLATNCNMCCYFGSCFILQQWHTVTGVWFLKSLDKCIFKIAAWQVMIKPMNKLIHPHTHYPAILKNTLEERTKLSEARLLSARSNSLGIVGPIVTANVLLKRKCWLRISTS